MLEYEFLKKTIQDSASDEIKRMREYFSNYVRHVFGIGTQEYLAQINEYENKKQAELRQKHAIPNPFVVDELVRPIDNIWQAKGGDES